MFVGTILSFVLLVAYARSREKGLKDLAHEPVQPLAQVGDLQRCRVTGHVLGPFGQPVMLAPLTGRPCVYYEVVVQKSRRTKQGTRWSEILRETCAVPFAIHDGTGRAIIDPYQHAGVWLVRDAQQYSAGAHTTTPAQQALLDRHGAAPPGWLFDPTLRYLEAVISVGELVTVLGQGVREPDPDGPPAADYRGLPAMRLRMAGAPDRLLVISDDPAATLSRGTPPPVQPPPASTTPETARPG